MCVRKRERERERECMCVCVCLCFARACVLAEIYFDCFVLCFVMGYVFQSGQTAHKRIHYHHHCYYQAAFSGSFLPCGPRHFGTRCSKYSLSYRIQYQITIAVWMYGGAVVRLRFCCGRDETAVFLAALSTGDVLR